MFDAQMLDVSAFCQWIIDRKSKVNNRAKAVGAAPFPTL